MCVETITMDERKKMKNENVSKCNEKNRRK